MTSMQFYRYNFKMTSQNSLFPFILLLTLIITPQALAPVSSCLANCNTCEPNNLSICKGSLPCEWGFHDPKANGNCELLPTLRGLSSELGERTDKTMRISSESWGDDARYSTCQYNFQGKKRIIDILGIFDGITTISKSFPVTPDRQIYEFSFNLIRDEWMPFNDFLLIDITSQEQAIESIQISYEQRKKTESQSTNILCAGKRYMNEKYNIKIANTRNQIGNDLTFMFTSFLSGSNWGITNVKLIEGCNAFSKFDTKTQTCTSCDTDSYLYQNPNGDLWCEKCPQLCSSCLSKTQCTTCIHGAKLTQGQCLFSNDYKLQSIDLTPLTSLHNLTTCGSSSFLMGSLGNTVVAPTMKNDQDQLYNEIQIGFRFYYNPTHWNDKSFEKIRVKINQIQAFTLNYRNFSNTASDYCREFKGNRVSSMNFVSQSMIQISSKLSIEFQLVGKNNYTFGVRDVFVKSLSKKDESKVQIGNSLSIKQIETVGAENQVEVANIPTTALPIPSTVSTPTPLTTNSQFVSSTSTQTETQIIVTPDASITNSSSNPMLSLQTNQHQLTTQSSDASNNSITRRQRSNLSYIPTTCQSNSGLLLTISNVSQIKGYISVTIDKLSANTYEVDSHFIDDGTLHLCLAISESFIDGTLTVSDSPTSTSRLLQATQSTVLAQATISRFDYISPTQKSSITSFSVFFQIFAWFGVIGIICAVMLGYGVTMQEYILSLQILFLHLYISTEILPLSFRDVIAGLRIIQNLNFFVPAQAKLIENQWMGNVIQNGPVKLSLYNTDINFSREFYPIFVINIIYCIWFCLVFFAKKYLLRYIAGNNGKSILERMAANFVNRVVNFADQIWRYQFLATVWFCFLQFHNLAYPNDSNRSQTMNTIFCVSCFVSTLAWPILIGYYCRKEYYENQYSEFIYKFEDIFYMRIPQFYLPTSHHRVGYPLFRIAKSFIIPMLIALIEYGPTILLALIVLHVLELVYTHNYDIYSDQKYFKLKIAENMLFIAIEVVMLLLYGMQSLASSNTFIALGFSLSALSVLIVLNSTVRAGYLSSKKYVEITGVVFEEMPDQDHKKLKTERVV